MCLTGVECSSVGTWRFGLWIASKDKPQKQETKPWLNRKAYKRMQAAGMHALKHYGKAGSSQCRAKPNLGGGAFRRDVGCRVFSSG